MIELFLVILGVGLIFLVGSFWFSVGVILVLLVLVLPGLYSMFFGAPFVTTGKRRREAIMKLADFGEEDVVYDLGCGDGRLIREVAEKGVKEAVGYEFSVPTYVLARLKSFLVGGREKIRFGNFWGKDFSDADVVMCFLLDRTMGDFEKKIWPTLKRGARVVSNEFRMRKIEPDSGKDRVWLYVKN